MKINAFRIKIILADREMNQIDLARKCCLTRQQIGDILSRKTCSLKNLGKIAKALGVPVSEIVMEET